MSKNTLKQRYKEAIGMIFIIYSTTKIYAARPQAHENRVVNKETVYKCRLKKDLNLSIILFTTLIIHISRKLEILNGINYFFAISSSLMIVALSINKINLKEGKGYKENFY